MRKADYPINVILSKTNHNLSNKPEKNYCRDAVENMKIHEWTTIAQYGRAKPGTIKLDVGEGDVPTPDFIVNAAQNAMNKGDMFYGPVLGSDELREAISSYYQRIYGHKIKSSRIFVTPSGTAAIHYSLSTLVDVGDEVVAVTPLWRNLLGAIDLQQGITKEVPLIHESGKGWKLDMDRLFNSCTEKTKVIIINSPNNPTGWIMPTEDMKTLMEYARKHDIWIVSDEVYSRVIYDTNRAPSFLDIAKEDDKLLVVNSFSKNWCMTGWRLGWITGPEKIAEKIYNVALYSAMGVSPFIQQGGIAALEQGEDFLKQMRKNSFEGREYIYERFKNIDKIISDKPEATFYSFFKIDGVDDCVSFTKELIDKKNIIFAPGYAFSKYTKGYMRLCFAVPKHKLEIAIDRLEEIIKDY